MRQVQRKLPDGREVVHRATLMFTQPVAANGAEGRREPIDPRDRITLPSGFAGVIIDVRGPVDPLTDAPYVLRVELGEAR
jgi:hypothetical protein